jgi:rsbT co-antagonist protein RsbR
MLRVALDDKAQRLGQGLHSRLLESGQGVLISSLSSDAIRAIIKPDYVKYIEHIGTHSVMLVPLRVRNHIIGTLATARQHDQGTYTETDLAFFQELADQAALTIENARLFSANVRELDERKRTEAALAASEERFRSLSASAPIGICFANVHGQCVYTNPHFQTIVGLGNEATLGSGWTTVIHPDDRERVLAEWRTCAAKGFEQTTEFRFERFDGTVRWVRARYAPMRSDAGVRLGLVGTIEDITERLQATQALRRVEQQLHTVISNAPLVLFAIDQNGVFTMVEGKGLAELGLTAEQLIGRSFFDVYQSLPDAYLDGPVERDPVRRALNGEEHTSVDILGGLTFETRWSPARAADGSVTGVTAVALDITERRRAEGEREKLASLVEHSSDTIGIASFDGKLLFLNTAGQQLLDISLDEAKETPVANCFAGDDYTYVQRHIVPNILREGRWFGEFRFKNNTTGALIPIDLNAFLVRDHYTNEPIALACVGRNITERKRADEILRASEATNRALLNAVPDLMFRISSNGIFLAYKPGKDQGVLLPPEAFIGNHLNDVMPPRVAQQTIKHIEIALRTGETQVFEYALHTERGSCVMARKKFLRLCVTLPNANGWSVACERRRCCSKLFLKAPPTLSS